MSNKPIQTTVTGRLIGGGVFEPREQENGGDPKFSSCVVLDENQSVRIQKIIAAAISEKWGNKKPAGLTTWGVREGDDEEYEASFGKEFINPKSTRQPRTIIKSKGQIEDVVQDDNVIYAGCFVAVSVSAYAYEGNKKKNIKPGVSLNLRAVMFLRDGDPLGDVVDADGEFEGLESDDFKDGDLDFLDTAA